MTTRVKIYFDGGCRPNPGAMEIAVVAGQHELIRRGIGPGSSMDAEWLALIEALSLAGSLGLPDYVLLGDAAAVIQQATGAVKCRGSARQHRERLLALAAPAGLPRIRYVKRSQNLAGIALARHHPR
jgi:ribonuclease HI